MYNIIVMSDKSRDVITGKAIMPPLLLPLQKWITRNNVVIIITILPVILCSIFFL